MGLVVVIFSYFIVALVMFFAGPLLFWFATKKFGKFEDNTVKKHALFWGAWLLINSIITFVQSALLGSAPQLADLMKGGAFLTLGTHIFLCMLIFKAQFIPALKASLSYVVLIVVTFLLVAFLAVQFSFHEIILGGLK